jgi:hypothetical protein
MIEPLCEESPRKCTKKTTFCCFNSKPLKPHEQGRLQQSSDGVNQKPLCRGFTIEEIRERLFQARSQKF